MPARRTISNTFTVTTVEDGESPILAVLNPAVGVVNCDVSGNVASERGIGVEVTMHEGTTILSGGFSDLKCYIETFELDSTYDDSSPSPKKFFRVVKSQSGGLYTGSFTLYVRAGTSIANSPEKVRCVVTKTIDGKSVTREALFSVSGVSKGSDGQDGKMGRSYYYGGVFNASDNSRTFTVNDAVTPFFKDSEQANTFHVFYPDENPQGGQITMAGMWAMTEEVKSFNKYPWKAMWNDFKYLITEAIFTAFGKLGSWYFNGDYMFSAEGHNEGGNVVSYGESDGSGGIYTFRGEGGTYGQGETAYTPNTYINAATGMIHTNNITLRGVVNNQIQVVNNSNKESVGWYNGSDTLYLNPLKIGQYLKIDINSIQSSLRLYLPTALYIYDDATRTSGDTVIGGLIDSSTSFTLTQLRQMVGKKIYLMPTSGLIIASFGLIVLKQTDYYIGNNNFVNDLNQVSSQTDSSGYASERYRVFEPSTPSSEAIDFQNDTKHFFVLECRVGRYNDHECIYWTVDASMAVLEEPQN